MPTRRGKKKRGTGRPHAGNLYRTKSYGGQAAGIVSPGFRKRLKKKDDEERGRGKRRLTNGPAASQISREQKRWIKRRLAARKGGKADAAGSP